VLASGTKGRVFESHRAYSKATFQVAFFLLVRSFQSHFRRSRNIACANLVEEFLPPSFKISRNADLAVGSRVDHSHPERFSQIRDDRALKARGSR
jgi:hypothetical protein